MIWMNQSSSGESEIILSIDIDGFLDLKNAYYDIHVCNT